MENVFCGELQKSIYDEIIDARCISISVSGIKISIYKNQCMINNRMMHSFEDNVKV